MAASPGGKTTHLAAEIDRPTLSHQSCLTSKVIASLMFLIGLLCACGGKAPSATPGESPAPSLTLIPATPMPTITPTPTPTFTPTPTTVPIVVHPNPRAAGSGMPGAQPGAPCGVADWLDFPIDPPDAADTWIATGYGGGTDGYSGIHAGDDFLMYKHQTLGAPVYSVGRGQVTYAEPRGWGADKGTVIVRHTFADGESVLSFYGHLDPDSVTRAVGSCVARGDKVGVLGQPRTPAHLHFEIRTHMPDRPGPGYWPSDPTAAGWLPPSNYIIYRRKASAPGLRWLRPLSAIATKFAGQIDATTFIVVEKRAVVGIAPSRIAPWLASTPPVEKRVGGRNLSGTIDAVRFNADRSLIFVASVSGDLEAWRPAKEGMAPELAWTVRPDVWGKAAAAAAGWRRRGRPRALAARRPSADAGPVERGDGAVVARHTGAVSVAVDGRDYGQPAQANCSSPM